MSPPSLSLPKGGGAIRGLGESFAVNAATGSGGLSVPLGLSPGRSGFGPELNLSYDSSSGDGPFGFGWSVSLPSVTRKTDKGLPEYRDADESDVFVLTGAEDLVPVLLPDGRRHEDATSVPGTTIHRYRPRVESRFARIERWTERASGEVHWRSISRENVTTIYGCSGNSRIADGRRVFSWLICEARDDKGNAAVYEYVAEDDANVDLAEANERNRARAANRYLKRVRYGNRTSHLLHPALATTEWLFEVVFDYDDGHYETLDVDPGLPENAQHRFVRASADAGRTWPVRPDPFSAYRSGFEVRTYRRCHRVMMFHRFPELGSEPCLVRATELDYGDLDYGQAVTVDDELAHQGSTRLGSFLRAVRRLGFVRDTRPPIVHNGVTSLTYLQRSLPPLELSYTRPHISDEVTEMDPASLENLPIGIDGSTYQWVDLDGEGVSGVLTEQAGALHYKPNLGDGRFGAVQCLALEPSLASLGSGDQQLMDLSGDGRLDLVLLGGTAPGFYERTDGGWEAFRAFSSVAHVPFDDPQVRLIDLDGDGHADVLLSEDEAFTWYRSLAEDGFGAPHRVTKAQDEERGPHLVFADGTQSVHLADMSGDGLADIVRIRNGEVAYWPNLGHGRFGAKVTMDDAPWFDTLDQFDERRIRLADLDGSGTTDVVYLGADAVRLYFNQMGNRWSTARPLLTFPPTDNLSAVMAVDLLGKGTACLVWSSPVAGAARRPLRFVDLMGAKPHLLSEWSNSLGLETRLQYTPSTTFYLADKAAGTPWITRLPFPVHVVDRVDTHDLVSGNRFVTRYGYRHGYFDPVEREFRGFGRVDRRDTEEYAALTGKGTLADATNLDAASQLPPVLTKTWFHTGAYLGGDRISAQFAGEYYREPGMTGAPAQAALLSDTPLDAGFAVEEEREACRALKGSMLREETYALDGSRAEPHPYRVVEQNFTVRVLQHVGTNRHAVFLVHPREALTMEYEREPTDPRVGHNLTLAVDDFGNVLQSTAIAYGRRTPDASLTGPDQAVQARHLLTCTENAFTNAVDTVSDHRSPLPSESRHYELTGLTLPPEQPRFQFQAIADTIASALLIAPEHQPTARAVQKRLIGQNRTLYRPDTLGGQLPLGQLQPLALPYEGYRLALTPGLASGTFGARLSATMLSDDGHYVHSEGDANWWKPSGRLFYSPEPGDTPAQELAYARAHFFLPHRYRDPFHTPAASTETLVRYDAYDLLLEETRDALGNRVTSGERDPDPTQPLVRAGNDYRVLAATLLMDPNRNRVAVALDALGMVVGTAAMGKPEDVPAIGDRLAAGFAADLTQAEIDQVFAQPTGAAAAALLGTATARAVYDVAVSPAAQVSLARETHTSQPLPPAGQRLQISVVYSDGLGREIQRKSRAEPGPVPLREAGGQVVLRRDGRPEMTATDVSPRWVASGWTIFNNKGKAVREYEPFFSVTHAYEFDVRVGVSPILLYDPAERVVATVNPNRTWEKTVFNAWQRESWDLNDTVLVADPGGDADVGGYVRRLAPSEYLPTWYAERAGGALGAAEQSAANKAAVHAATPTAAHVDALGRTFLTVEHNRLRYSNSPTQIEALHAARVSLDINGDELEVFDAAARLIARQRFDLLRARLLRESMDAGQRWTLTDAAGKTIYAWDSLDRQRRIVYDRARRPAQTWLAEGAAPEMLIGSTAYGESSPAPEAGNLRGRARRVQDQAGVLTTDEYDFKGNLAHSRRELVQAYGTTVDWSVDVALEADSYTSRTEYDALNRAVRLTSPDGSVIRPTFNEARLLERVDANLQGELNAGQPVWTAFVSAVTYNAEGRRLRIDYANGARTTYAYDPLTSRLRRLVTERGGGQSALQDLHFTYDAVGNVTRIRDDAHQRIFFRNRLVDPGSDLTYDAIYRLIEATGREHLGQVGGAPVPHSYNDAPRVGIPWSANDGNAMGRYLERYVYDAAGNPLTVRHSGTDPLAPGWTRTHEYAEANALAEGQYGNRLTRATVGSATEVYSVGGNGYDLHGGMLRMPQLQALEWDVDDRLRMTRRQAVDASDADGQAHEGERTFYTYDAGGQRVRKITESAAGHIKEERIYVGGFERYRRHGTGPLVRDTLHISDDKQRLAIVENRTQGAKPGVAARIVSFQHDDLVGSARLLLDDQARILSYEEYTPYGCTTYQAVRSQLEAPKRYRNAGKERDDESGLYYYGARYYAPWLMRWVSCDRTGHRNLYLFARANPAHFHDPDGREESSWSNRLWGGVRLVGGAAQAIVGVAVFVQVEIPVLAQVAGGVAIVHGWSDMSTGIAQMISGRQERSPIEQAVSGVAQAAHMEQHKADALATVTDITLGFVNPAGAITGGPRAAMQLAASGPRLANEVVQVSRAVTVVDRARQVSQVTHMAMAAHTVATNGGSSSSGSAGSSSSSSSSGAGSNPPSDPSAPPSSPSGPNATQIPEEFSAEASRAIDQGSLQPSGAMLNDLSAYAHAPEARAQMGSPSAQGAHIAPQSAMRTVPGYDPRSAIARMLDPVPHAGFDNPWKRDFLQRWLTTGEKTVTAGELFERVSNAARANPHFTPGEAQSMIELLEDELRIHYGLSPGSPVRAPYSR